MKYNVSKLKEVTYDTDTLVGRNMVVWDGETSIASIRYVNAWFKRNRNRCHVLSISQNGILWYDHMSEVPEEERLMTNRMLAEWLAKGFGDRTSDGYNASIDFMYPKDDVDLSVDTRVLIRRWNETEWHKPLLKYYLEDVKK